MTDEVLRVGCRPRTTGSWPAGRVRTLNRISAIRAVEKQDPELAERIALAPLPAGPAGRLGPAAGVGVYVIWRFAKNQELAKRFLVDLALNYREAFMRSESSNLPAFPGAARDLDQLLSSDRAAQLPGKYTLLADAKSWSTNIGHPGHASAAMDEVFNQFIVPKMFAAAAGRNERGGGGGSRRGPNQADLRKVAGAGQDLSVGRTFRSHAAQIDGAPGVSACSSLRTPKVRSPVLPIQKGESMLVRNGSPVFRGLRLRGLPVADGSKPSRS